MVQQPLSVLIHRDFDPINQPWTKTFTDAYSAPKVSFAPALPIYIFHSLLSKYVSANQEKKSDTQKQKNRSNRHKNSHREYKTAAEEEEVTFRHETDRRDIDLENRAPLPQKRSDSSNEFYPQTNTSAKLFLENFPEEERIF